MAENNRGFISSEYSFEVCLKDNIEWARIISQFDDASVYQTRSYGSIHWSEKELKHFLCKKGPVIIAAAQVRVFTLPIIGADIIYVRYGPMWRRREEEPAVENYRIAIKSLVNAFSTNKRAVIRVLPNVADNSVFSNSVRSILAEEGFAVSSRRHAYETFLLDLSPPLDIIRKNLDQKWRNQLNRGEKNNLSITEGIGNNLFAIFLELQKNMLERKKFLPGVDYEEFFEIQKDLPDSHKMNIIICNDQGGTPLSAAVVSCIGDNGIYLLGATGDNGMKAKGSYRIQWRIVEWLKSRNCRFYDLGGIDLINNPGVYHFKEGLSGNRVSFVGEFDKSSNPLLNLIIAIFEFIRPYQWKLKQYLKSGFNLFPKRIFIWL